LRSGYPGAIDWPGQVRQMADLEPEANRRRLTQDLSGDDLAARVAEAIAQNTGCDVTVIDCDGIALWTIRPKVLN
jgi:hypothetical protein